MSGWIKLHRDLIDKAIWKCSTPEQKVILITILCMVNHKPSQWLWKGKKFSVQAGQMITSVDSIVKECGKVISVKNVRTALAKFKNLGFLAYESANDGTLLTIINWELYQGNEDESGKAIGKPLANWWQTTGKLVATKEEGKNKRMKESNTPLPPSGESVLENDENFENLNALIESNDHYKPLQEEKEDLENQNQPAKLENSIQKFDSKTAFLQFWENYPKKQAHKQAEKSFEKTFSKIKGKDKGDELFLIILAKLKAFCQSEQWAKDNGKFIPMASTWLNQERWRDELEIGAIQNPQNANPDLFLKVVAKGRTLFGPEVEDPPTTNPILSNLIKIYGWKNIYNSSEIQLKKWFQDATK